MKLPRAKRRLQDLSKVRTSDHQQDPEATSPALHLALHLALHPVFLTKVMLQQR
jgi:hypothetical protein